jgi:hypothetical protein
MRCHDLAAKGKLIAGENSFVGNFATRYHASDSIYSSDSAQNSGGSLTSVSQ